MVAYVFGSTLFMSSWSSKNSDFIEHVEFLDIHIQAFPNPVSTLQLFDINFMKKFAP